MNGLLLDSQGTKTSKQIHIHNIPAYSFTRKIKEFEVSSFFRTQIYQLYIDIWHLKTAVIFTDLNRAFENCAVSVLRCFCLKFLVHASLASFRSPNCHMIVDSFAKFAKPLDFLNETKKDFCSAFA